MRIYQRLRPGNPPQLEKARELFHEKFFDTNRYRLGKVGRFRINRKFNQNVPDDQMTLDPQDYVNAIRYIMQLRAAMTPGSTSTTSTTWGTGGCGPSTSWRPTSCARGFSSSVAPCRSG